MERAARGASSKRPGWTSEAVLYVRRYAERHREFLTEFVRHWAESNGCPKPGNEKAWGPAIKQAEREGIVKAVGVARAADSNLSFKVRWESLVYREGGDGDEVETQLAAAMNLGKRAVA